MLYTSNSRILQPTGKQRGAALVISLILLLIMTLLGLAGIRGVTQQERMANHSFDRSLAFQSTEAALSNIEQTIESKTPTKPEPSGSACGLVAGLMLCPTPTAGSTPRWLDDTFTSWQALSAVGTGSLAVSPEYFIEYMGGNFECSTLAPDDEDLNPSDPAQPSLSDKTCKRYRITARSNDGDGSRSYVMLQSIYATDDD